MLETSDAGLVAADAVRFMRTTSPFDRLKVVTLGGNPLDNHAQDIYLPELAEAGINVTSDTAAPLFISEIGDDTYYTGDAIVFDGQDDVITLPEGTVDGLEDLTITWRSAFTAVNSGVWTILSGARLGEAEVLTVAVAPTQMLFRTAQDETVWISLPVFADGMYHDYAIVRDNAAGTAELFIDGVSFGNGNDNVPAGPIDVDPGGVLIGRR